MSVYLIAKAEYRVKILDPVDQGDIDEFKYNFQNAQREAQDHFSRNFDMIDIDVTVEVEDSK